MKYAISTNKNLFVNEPLTVLNSWDCDCDECKTEWDCETLEFYLIDESLEKIELLDYLRENETKLSFTSWHNLYLYDFSELNQFPKYKNWFK